MVFYGWTISGSRVRMIKYKVVHGNHIHYIAILDFHFFHYDCGDSGSILRQTSPVMQKSSFVRNLCNNMIRFQYSNNTGLPLCTSIVISTSAFWLRLYLAKDRMMSCSNRDWFYGTKFLHGLNACMSYSYYSVVQNNVRWALFGLFMSFCHDVVKVV